MSNAPFKRPRSFFEPFKGHHRVLGSRASVSLLSGLPASGPRPQSDRAKWYVGCCFVQGDSSYVFLVFVGPRLGPGIRPHASGSPRCRGVCVCVLKVKFGNMFCQQLYFVLNVRSPSVTVFLLGV